MSVDLPEIEVCRIFDGKLSVRLDGKEIYVLNNRFKTYDDDIKNLVKAILSHFSNEVEKDVDEELQEIEEEIREEVEHELEEW